MYQTLEEIADDLVRMDYDDKSIHAAFENLRRECISKGVPYRELAMSKTYGTIKYIVMELPTGTILITDMDNGTTFTMDAEAAKPPQRAVPTVTDWIKATNR